MLDTPLQALGLSPLVYGGGGDSPLALAALRTLLEHFPTRGGVGVSGVNFFAVPGVARAEDRRDILVLESLSDTLALLAGPSFAAAFGNSTNQEDYRWGKLHRVVFGHPLGAPFTIPPAQGQFPQPLPGLPGIPIDGGLDTVDVGFHDARVDSVNAFMSRSGPQHRFVSEPARGRMRAMSSLPGGASGLPDSPFYLNLLPGYLTNEAFPLLFKNDEVQKNAFSVTKFTPANGADDGEVED